MAKYTEAQIKALGAKGHAFRNPDGHYSYPIDDDEDLDNAIRAVGRGGASHDSIRAYIIRRAKEMGKSSMIPDNWSAGGSNDSGDSGSASRGELVRDYPLEDLHIVRSGEGGDGRTVEAFAAVFNTETEIQDHQGHYLEVISPTAFNKRISDLRRSRQGFGAVKVIFNHGRSPEGVPVERFMMPVAKPVSVEATDRGLLTRSRYFDTPLGNEVLELIRDGGITSQSFVGKIVRSDPELGRHGRHRPDSSGRLTTVHRTELGLREYGAVIFPAYEGAEVLGVRMSTPGTWEPDETDGTTPDDVAAAGEPPPDDEHSYRHSLFVARLRLERERRGIRRSTDK